MSSNLRTILAGLLFTGVAAGAADADDNSFAVRDVRVFDGENVIPAANVVVSGGRIAAVAKDASIPAGMDVIDGRGKTLLPGLIDSHVHIFPGAQQDALRFGVTTELDMFDLARDFAHWKPQRGPSHSRRHGRAQSRYRARRFPARGTADSGSGRLHAHRGPCGRNVPARGDLWSG